MSFAESSKAWSQVQAEKKCGLDKKAMYRRCFFAVVPDSDQLIDDSLADDRCAHGIAEKLCLTCCRKFGCQIRM
jgi:hypothetical protein